MQRFSGFNVPRLDHSVLHPDTAVGCRLDTGKDELPRIAPEHSAEILRYWAQRGLITADAFINKLPAERSGHVDDGHNAAESSRYYLACIKLYPHVSMRMRQGLPGLRQFLITKF